MGIIIVITLLMWLGQFPMEFSPYAIFFAAFVLALRLFCRFFNLYENLKRGRSIRGKEETYKRPAKR